MLIPRQLVFVPRQSFLLRGHRHAAGLIWIAVLACVASVTAAAEKELPVPLTVKSTRISAPLNPQRAAAALLAPTVASATYPLADTFRLHSRPTATKVIYLDFDGHTTTRTAWNSGNPTITTSAFSFEGDSTFTNNELVRIQEIWERVSECFSPFDVDVTTQAPTVADLLNTGGADTRWGVRAAIGTSSPSPAPGAAGVAYVDAFGWNYGTGYDTPAFVFSEVLSNSAKYVADATVHEVGHTLGMDHDGRNSPAEEYYTGHGSGATGWAPHMGVGYYQPLVQWSKGEYLSANNIEDDLAIITTQGFGFRADDFANTQSTATNIGTTVVSGVTTITQSGVIEQRTDADWFKITAPAGTLSLNATGSSVNTMLDIRMDLYNASGVQVSTSNPDGDVTAAISATVTAGTYFVKIDGVGKGTPTTTGYSDYGSLGRYRITGTIPSTTNNVTVAYNTTTKVLTVTGDAAANVATVTVQNGNITVAGSAGTKINNGTASFVVSTTGRVGLNASMGDGNDSLVVTGMLASTINVSLLAGADSLRLTYCDVSYLRLNGGTGTDTFTYTTSVIAQQSVVYVP